MRDGRGLTPNARAQPLAQCWQRWRVFIAVCVRVRVCARARSRLCESSRPSGGLPGRECTDRRWFASHVGRETVWARKRLGAEPSERGTVLERKRLGAEPSGRETVWARNHLGAEPSGRGTGAKRRKPSGPNRALSGTGSSARTVPWLLFSDARGGVGRGVRGAADAAWFGA